MPQSPAAAPRRGLILAALMCTMLLTAMDTTIVSTAIPQIVGDLGGFQLFSWVFSTYLLAQTVTIPIYGKLSDLFGRKPVLLVGTCIFLLGSAASALSFNMVSLIIFRSLQGLGAGAVMATVATLAGDLYTVRERAAVQGWLSSVWGISAIVGPLLGGAFAEYVSWRWIFLVNLPVGVAALLLIALFLQEDFERRSHRIDYLGASLILLSIGMFILGILQGGEAWAWSSPQSIGVFMAAILLFGATILVEQRAAEPIIPGWLWRRRVLVGANLATVGMGIIMMAPLSYLPTFLQSVKGANAIVAGLVLATMSIGWPTASALSGRLYMRIGFRDTALLGTLLILTASLFFLQLPASYPLWLVVCEQVLLGAGFGLLSTPLLVGVQSICRWEERGVVTSGNMFSRYLGQSLGAALFGALFNASLSNHLKAAPAAIARELPGHLDNLLSTLQESAISAATHAYLQEAISLATRHLFMGMAALGLLVLLLVLATPRHFRALDIGGPQKELAGKEPLP